MIPFTAARRLCGAASAVLLSLVLSAGRAVAEIIPSDRTAPWQGNVGVPGGIPNRTIIYKNVVTDLGADPTGAVDAAPIIQRAILSCPVGQVVYMPAGTFKIATPIYLASKSNFTLRGAGQGQTILHVTAPGVPIYSSGLMPWPPPTAWLSISAGATKGSNTITVSNTSNFSVDSLFKIGPPTLPTWAHNLNGIPDKRPSMGGTFKVRSKTATTVTFDPPLPFDFSGMNPMAQPWPGLTPVRGVGYESFTVNMADTQAGWAIQFNAAWGCWMYDVEIKHAYTRQTYSETSARLTYSHNYIHNAQAQGPNHEGLDFHDSSWDLIEDNIFNQAGSMAVIWENVGNGSIGNVIAYNYITNAAPGWWDISVNHGPHNMLNLIEGNVIDWYKDDGYFGSSSHNTLFRNRIRSQIALKHFSNYYNVVGNVLGTVTGPPAGPWHVYNDAYEVENANYSVWPIYELGFPNIGNKSFSGTFGPTTPPNYSGLPNTLDGTQQLDRNVKATMLRHGNFDYVNNTTVWNPAIPDHTIPNSLYLSGKPSWWGNLPWPPIGPDRSPMAGQIPAEYRFLNGLPTPAPTPTSTSSATPSSPQNPQIKNNKKKQYNKKKPKIQKQKWPSALPNPAAHNPAT
jgi:hypothetical protein